MSRTRSFIRFSELESLSLDMIRWLVTCALSYYIFVKVAHDRETL
jgi:hypothetical protein